MHRLIGTAVLFGAAFASACSKDAPKADSAAVAQASATPAAPAAGYDPATRTVTAIAKDFAFVAPDTIPAGWTTFRLINEGPNFHHMQIVRLDQGKTFADLQAGMKNPGPPPKWMVAVGGPNGPDPKTESNTTMNLTPGNYVMLCFVDIPDHVPHMAKGMVRPFTVTGTAAGTEPVADVTVSLADYAFTVKSGTLAAGKHTVKVVNDGPQDHEIELLRLAPGKTMKDFGAWAAKFEGPPPVSGIGGIAGLVKGSSGYFNVDLTPGNYIFICFVPDGKDQKGHFEHGMVKEFTIQ